MVIAAPPATSRRHGSWKPHSDSANLPAHVARFGFIDADSADPVDRGPIDLERASELAQAFIRKRLHKEHWLTPCQNGFVVIFGAIDALGAVIAACSMEQAINKFFHQSEAQHYLKIEARCETLFSRDLVEFLKGAGVAKPIRPSQGELARAAESEGADIALQFQPIWDVRREIVAAHGIEAVNGATRRVIPGYRFEVDVKALRPFVEIDEIVLRASVVALRLLSDADRKTMVSVPIHVSNLVRFENRIRLLKALSALDRDLMHRLIVRVCGVVRGFPRIALKDIVNALAVRAPNVVIGMSALESDLESVLLFDASGVSFSIPSDCASPNDPGIRNAIRRNAALARSGDKQAYLEGPLTLAQARAYAEYGIDFMSSHLVWPSSSSPLEESGSPSLRAEDAWIVDHKEMR